MDINIERKLFEEFKNYCKFNCPIKKQRTTVAFEICDFCNNQHYCADEDRCPFENDKLHEYNFYDYCKHCQIENFILEIRDRLVQSERNTYER